MSDVLVEFAQPLLVDLPEDVDVYTRERTLSLAAGLWNIVVMAEVEAPNVHPSEPAWLDLRAVQESIDIVRDIADDSPPDEETISVLRMMAARKQNVAPTDRRFVEKVSVKKIGDGVVVTATSMS